MLPYLTVTSFLSSEPLSASGGIGILTRFFYHISSIQCIQTLILNEQFKFNLSDIILFSCLMQYYINWTLRMSVVIYNYVKIIYCDITKGGDNNWMVKVKYILLQSTKKLCITIKLKRSKNSDFRPFLFPIKWIKYTVTKKTIYKYKIE